MQILYFSFQKLKAIGLIALAFFGRKPQKILDNIIMFVYTKTGDPLKYVFFDNVWMIKVDWITLDFINVKSIKLNKILLSSAYWMSLSKKLWMI